MCGPRRFGFSGLVPQSYRLEFNGGESAFDEWYQDATTEAAATDVVVVAGSATAANASLAPVASFKGTVVLPAGALMDGEVLAYDRATGNVVAGVAPDADGNFNLYTDDGDFYVRFFGFTGAANVYFDGSTTYGGAKKASASPTRTNLGQVSLAKATQLSGTLSPPSWFGSGTVCAYAVHPNNGGYLDGYCGARGKTFALHSIPAGKFKLVFTNSRGDYWFFGDTRVLGGESPAGLRG